MSKNKTFLLSLVYLFFSDFSLVSLWFSLFLLFYTQIYFLSCFSVWFGFALDFGLNDLFGCCCWATERNCLSAALCVSDVHFLLTCVDDVRLFCGSSGLVFWHTAARLWRVSFTCARLWWRVSHACRRRRRTLHSPVLINLNWHVKVKQTSVCVCVLSAYGHINSTKKES